MGKKRQQRRKWQVAGCEDDDGADGAQSCRRKVDLTCRA